jgi:hypothetical protein
MTNTSEFDFEGYGKLPQHVIKQAAAEYITRYLMPEIEGFFSFAVDALALDCEISAEEAEAVLTDRLKSMAQGLKQGQFTRNHAAIFWHLHGLFEDLQDERLFEVNEGLAKYQLMDCQPIESAPPDEDNPIECDEPQSSAQDVPLLNWQDWQGDNENTGNHGAN